MGLAPNTPDLIPVSLQRARFWGTEEQGAGSWSRNTAPKADRGWSNDGNPNKALPEYRGGWPQAEASQAGWERSGTHLFRHRSPWGQDSGSGRAVATPSQGQGLEESGRFSPSALDLGQYPVPLWCLSLPNCLKKASRSMGHITGHFALEAWRMNVMDPRVRRDDQPDGTPPPRPVPPRRGAASGIPREFAPSPPQ